MVDRVIKPLRIRLEIEVARKAAKRKIVRKEYTASDIKLLKMHSKTRTPISKLAKLMKRSEGSLRQKALNLGIIDDKTVARFVTVAMDSGLPSRINLVILDGAHDFQSIFNAGPGRNWRASPFGANSGHRRLNIRSQWLLTLAIDQAVAAISYAR